MDLDEEDDDKKIDAAVESLNNEPTSVWIPGDEDRSSISSVTKSKAFSLSREEATQVSYSEETSLPSGLFESERSNSLSGSGNLHFSKRLSDTADELNHLMLKPASFHESQRRSSTALPVTTLRFDSLGLVGREEEKAVLERRLNIVAAKTIDESQKGNRELVLISGEAGTGKTALALTLTKSIKRMDGLFVKGKFDLYLRDEPYAGITSVCRGICGRILQMRNGEKTHGTSFENIRQELIDTLGSENLQLLNSIVPELGEIVGDELFINTIRKKQTNEESKARLNYAFRTLFQVVARRFAPLVILLDDLQWSDAATLDLLQVLITDSENPSLYLIGIYRSNEADGAHVLSQVIDDLKDEANQADFTLTEIVIGNLTMPQTHQIIMELLSIDDETTTLELANICYKRTYGNPFSLRIFLEMLRVEGLLHFSIGEFKWRWDEAIIVSETAATANVVDLMRQKIEKLPPRVCDRLPVAACLGFSFEPATLNAMWGTICRQRGNVEEHENESISADSKDWLLLVEEEGILEREKDGVSYRWVHDKVQEAAMSLLSPDALASLKSQVGRILVSELDDEDLDAYIFTVVNLLHEGASPTKESERIELASLSLRASRKAYNLSAFVSAGKFATIGVEVLPAMNRWTTHYELSLDLYSTSAEVAGYLGNTETMKKCHNEVLAQEDRPMSDKLRVYRAMISYMAGALGKPHDAIELLLKILAEYGIRFPKRKSSRLILTISGALKAKRKISSLRLEDIAVMPTMDDPVRASLCKICRRRY